MRRAAAVLTPGLRPSFDSAEDSGDSFIGYTIPGQAWTYWNKGPGPGEEE